MSSNWAELRKELKEVAGNSRKRKLPAANADKWKKKRAEIARAEKDVSELVAPPTKVLAIDCEYVGVGPSGLENMLARVSIVNVEGLPVYDKYVRPTEEVMDYRTEVSGIRPGHLARGAVPFGQIQSEVKKLLADNILIGHSVHNDFKVLGLTHPPKLIRDTAKYKVLREELDEPNKTPSLKLLAHRLLGVQIQQGEHDSVMDARIALRVYQKYREKWEKTVKVVKKKTKK